MMSHHQVVNIVQTHVKIVVKELVGIRVTIHVGIPRLVMVVVRIVQVVVQLLALEIAHLHAILAVLLLAKLDVEKIVVAHANPGVLVPALMVAVEAVREAVNQAASVHVLTVVRMVVEVHVKDVLEVARGSVTDNAPVHALPPAQAHVKMVVMIGVITIVRAT